MRAQHHHVGRRRPTALTMSPLYLMPPSAMTGMPYLAAISGRRRNIGGDLGHADARHHAGGADGAGADAHLHRSRRPRRSRASVPSAVATLPAISCRLGIALLHQRGQRPKCPRLWPWAESSTTASTWASTKAADAVQHVLGGADGGSRTAGGRSLSRAELGYCTAFSISLMVIRPFRLARARPQWGASQRGGARQNFLGLLQGGAHRGGDQVVLGSSRS